MSIPKRVLGRTGEEVSILCLGGWHIRSIQDDDEAIRVMHAAIDRGVTFFDNSWDYQWGASEELMGRALEMDSHRKNVFLMTKTCERDYAGALKCLDDSLRRLRTDYIDLWQFHELVYDNDPEWIYERGGLRAALEAKKAGKVKYIGFTGHKHPAIHLEMLSRSDDWDATLVPINVMDPFYRSFIKQLIPVCEERNVGVLGMKGLGGGYPEARFVTHTTLNPADCYRFALSQKIASQVIGVTSMAQLEANLPVAENFVPMSAEEQAAFLATVKDIAGDGRHETFKSTNQHDGPHHRAQHGFDPA